MLELTIIAATFPGNTDKRDIYCRAVYNGQKQQTKVEMDTVDGAKWDEKFQIDNTIDKIVIQIVKWDGKSEEQQIGECIVKVSEVVGAMTLPFEGGELQIQLERVEHPELSANDKAKQFQKYLLETGLEPAFKLIFAEILTKKIDKTEAFTYAALRLRQMGEDLKMFFNNHPKMGSLLNNISEVQQDDEPDHFLESNDQVQ